MWSGRLVQSELPVSVRNPETTMDVSPAKQEPSDVMACGPGLQNMSHCQHEIKSNLQKTMEPNNGRRVSRPSGVRPIERLC